VQTGDEKQGKLDQWAITAHCNSCVWKAQTGKHQATVFHPVWALNDEYYHHFIIKQKITTKTDNLHISAEKMEQMSDSALTIHYI